MFIIPIFIPHMGCPHRCVFCNQNAITGVTWPFLTSESLKTQIDQYLGYNKKNKRPIQIAFYGGNFLGLDKDTMLFLLNVASKYVASGDVTSLRFSTRPDTIDKITLDIIDDFPVSTIELGVQSMDDRVLALSHRGHTALHTENAVSLLKKRNYEIGLQMMVGLPGDDGEASLTSAKRLIALSPDFIRIYPTVVLKGSPLSAAFQKGEYVPMDLEQCVTLVKEIYLLFKEKNITVIRMGLQLSEDLEDNAHILKGPYHPAFGHMVFSEIFLDKAIKELKAKGGRHNSVSIRVHPKNISKMRGQKNRNIEILKKRFQIRSLSVLPDENMARDGVVISQ